VWHGVLLVFGAPFQLPLLAGPEHGRTIPLPEVSATVPVDRQHPLEHPRITHDMHCGECRVI